MFSIHIILFWVSEPSRHWFCQMSTPTGIFFIVVYGVAHDVLGKEGKNREEKLFFMFGCWYGAFSHKVVQCSVKRDGKMKDKNKMRVGQVVVIRFSAVHVTGGWLYRSLMCMCMTND